MGFEKYDYARIVACQQTGFFGFLPWFHKGVCNPMVMDWFRRIEKGRLTWLATRNRQTDELMGRQKVNWEKKRDRWMHIQKTGDYRGDRRFGYTSRPHDLQSGNDETVVVSSTVTVNGT